MFVPLALIIHPMIGSIAALARLIEHQNMHFRCGRREHDSAGHAIVRGSASVIEKPDSDPS